MKNLPSAFLPEARAALPALLAGLLGLARSRPARPRRRTAPAATGRHRAPAHRGRSAAFAGRRGGRLHGRDDGPRQGQTRHQSLAGAMGRLGKPRADLRRNKQTHPRWSPDGKTLAFLSSRTDEHEDDQALAPADRRAARPSASPRSRAAWKISPGRPIPSASCSSSTIPTRAIPEGHEKDKKTVPPLVIDRFQFKQDIEGYLTGPLPAPAPARPGHAQGRKPHRRQARRRAARLVAGRPGDRVRHQARRRPRPHRKLGRVRDRRPDRARGAPVDHRPRRPTASPMPNAPRSGVPTGNSIAYLHGGGPEENRVRRQHAGGDPRQAAARRASSRAALDRNVIQPHWAADGKSISVLVEDDGAQTSAHCAGGRRRAGNGRRRPARDHGVRMAAGGHTVALASTPERPYERKGARNPREGTGAQP